MSRPVATALTVQAVLVAGLLLVVADQRAHQRVEQAGGVNVWGYRGAVARHKRPNEVRLVAIGGNLAFGWGVAPSETMAAYTASRVEGAINRTGEAPTWVTVANLGAMGLPASEYDDRLATFPTLAPDVTVVILDLVAWPQSPSMPPRESGIAALTGYVPMLPLAAEEKGARLDAQGRRLMGALLVAAGRGMREVDAGLHRVLDARNGDSGEDRLVSAGKVVHAALGLSSKGVVVVVPWPDDPASRVEHDRLREALDARAAQSTRLRVVDLATEPRLADPALRLDRVNLGAQGHWLAAQLIAPAVVDLRGRGADAAP